MSEQGGAGGHAPPPMLEEGVGRVSFGPPKFRGPRPTIGLVFFTNVLCLLFESAIPGGKKHNIDHIL